VGVINASAAATSTPSALRPDHIRKIGSSSIPRARRCPTRPRRAASRRAFPPASRNSSEHGNILASMIFSGALERHRAAARPRRGGHRLDSVRALAMDASGDQFKDSRSRCPSDTERQCYATYQTDPIAPSCSTTRRRPRHVGSDFPHPDACGPTRREYVQREMGHLPPTFAQDRLRERRALYGSIRRERR